MTYGRRDFNIVPMANRNERAQLAAETVAITQSGTYVAPSGNTVVLRPAIESAIQHTRLIRPDETESLRGRVSDKLSARSFATTFGVANEGTFTAARRLVQRFGPDKVAALNFASAKNPGGGFLGGSQAQEEALARSSAVYACLQRQPHYYESNRAESSLLYTDHMIVSPRVPVFRDEEDRLLEGSLGK